MSAMADGDSFKYLMLSWIRNLTRGKKQYDCTLRKSGCKILMCMADKYVKK